MNLKGLAYTVSFLWIGFILGGCLNDDLADDFVSPQEQLEEDIAEIDQYLEDNNITAIKDESGLRYVVTEEGTGVAPKRTDSVRVTYTARLLDDNTVVDSGENQVSKLNGRIGGWQIGLPLVKEGSKVTLYVPSGYGYGNIGFGKVPGRAILIYEIDLIEVIPDSKEITAPYEQLQLDIAEIDQYLSSKGIQAIKHYSGIRYVIKKAGEGNKPLVTDEVKVNYKGSLLDSDLQFDAGNGLIFRISDLIIGWQIGIPLLNEGTEATIYIPSGYGYGIRGNGEIPPNANLVFDIDLLEVK